MEIIRLSKTGADPAGDVGIVGAGSTFAPRKDGSRYRQQLSTVGSASDILRLICTKQLRLLVGCGWPHGGRCPARHRPPSISLRGDLGSGTGLQEATTRGLAVVAEQDEPPAPPGVAVYGVGMRSSA